LRLHATPRLMGPMPLWLIWIVTQLRLITPWNKRN